MKVSVLIPTYNRSGLVCEAIQSVLSQQSFCDYEILVIDDGSTDDTSKKMTAFGDRIRYIRQSNGGVNHARNHGLSLSRGEYIATLDNDDLWEPYKLALQVRILDQFPEVAYTFSNFSIYRHNGDITRNGLQTWFPVPPDWDRFYPRSVPLRDYKLNQGLPYPGDTRLYFGDLYHASLRDPFVLPSTALFRKSMIPENTAFVDHDPICGDWDFFARLSRDRPVAYLDYETAHNRSHEDEYRLTRTKWKRQLELRADMIERLYMKDDAFYRQNRAEVDSVYTGYLRALCRQYLLDGNTRLARETLRKHRAHGGSRDLSCLAMGVASYVPGIPGTLRSLRALRGRRNPG